MMNENQRPAVVVGALLFNSVGEMLLLKTHKWGNKWVVPGGHIEAGETMEGTVRREIKEETGLDVFDVQFLGIQESIFDEAFWKKKHFIFLDFICKTNETNVKLNQEAEDFKWTKPQDALALELATGSRKAVEQALKAQNRH